MKRIALVSFAALAALLLGIAAGSLPDALRAQTGLISAQVLANTVYNGPSAKGAGVLQTGQVSTLSAAVTNTLTRVVTGSASTQIYVRGIWVEKATTGTGSVTVSYGTRATTDCDTGPTTLVALGAASGQVLNFGYTPLGIRVPAGKDLCLQTDASTTSVRALAQ